MKRFAALLLALAICAPALAQRRPEWIENANEVLFQRAMGVALWQWIGIVSIALFAFVVSVVARMVVMGALKVRDHFLDPPLGGGVKRYFRRSVALLAFAWAAMAAGDALVLHGWILSALTKSLVAIEALGFILAACGVWDLISDRIANRVAGQSKRAERLLIPLTNKLVRATVVVVGVLITVAELTGVSLSALLASLGIGGIVIALAAKDSVENVFGSLTILFDMPFALGDWVKIGTVEGVVEEINLRSTRIRTFEDTIVNLPNANLIRAAVENYGARRVRRQRLLLRVNPDNSEATIGQFCEKLKAYLTSKEGVQAERVVVALDSLDDMSMAVLVQCHFEADDYQTEMRLRDELLRTALRLRDECGVLLASEPRIVREARLNPPKGN